MQRHMPGVYRLLGCRRKMTRDLVEFMHESYGDFPPEENRYV